MKKKTGPPAKEFTSADDLKAFIDSKDVVVVGFFKDKESAEAKQFIEAASDIDDTEFAIAANDLKGYEQDKDASVVLYKKVCLIQLSQAWLFEESCFVPHHKLSLNARGEMWRAPQNMFEKENCSH